MTPSFNREGLEPNNYPRLRPCARHLFQMSLKTYSAVLLLVATAVPACPQVRFEVASLRPSQPGPPRDARGSIRGDRLEVHAYTVRDILDWSNGFQLHRVVGGPDWMGID